MGHDKSKLSTLNAVMRGKREARGRLRNGLALSLTGHSGHINRTARTPAAADMSLRGSNGNPRSRLPFQEPTKPATLSRSKLLLFLTVLAKSGEAEDPVIELLRDVSHIS